MFRAALTRGYFYAAATPMSIFGSLGVVRAGFKALVACFSFNDIEGAKIRQGDLSLMMVDAGKASKGKNTGTLHLRDPNGGIDQGTQH